LKEDLRCALLEFAAHEDFPRTAKDYSRTKLFPGIPTSEVYCDDKVRYRTTNQLYSPELAHRLLVIIRTLYRPISGDHAEFAICVKAYYWNEKKKKNSHCKDGGRRGGISPSQSMDVVYGN
jgi:hypothetical protein